MALNTDYTSLANQLKLDNANSILGQAGTPSIAGISGDLLQDWANLGANSSAYKKLVEAEKTGSIKKNNYYTELMSDKYFNDYYDPETGKIKKATYTPVGSASSGIPLNEEDTSGDLLGDMRSLALAAISNPNNLNSNHYDFFEKMRARIASNFVSGQDDDKKTVTTDEAQAAKATKDFDYRLLLEDQTFTVAGSEGEKTYNFGVGTSIEDVAAAINADSADTGVKAEMVETEDGTLRMELTSVDTGKDAFVRVDQTRGDMFAAPNSSLSAKGKDAVEKEVDAVASGEDTQAAVAGGLYTGETFEDLAFTIAGRKGSEKFEFARGATAEEIVAAINEASENTGVTAQVIRNADGEAEGIGLLAEKSGTGNYIQVRQEKGSLFAKEGGLVNVSGSSDESGGDGPAIGSLADLGRVNIDGVTYSFEDLRQGGKASLANNPEAALAVLDQTLKDIYEGRAEIKGFDPSEMYVPGLKSGTGRDDSTNTYEYGNYGSDAMTDWIGKYIREE